MAIKIDFTGQEGMKSFDPIPRGKYLVEVSDYREKETSENANNPGMPLISWAFQILEGEYENRIVWDNMAIIPPSEKTKGTLWRVKGLLEACGFDVPDGEIDFDPEDVLGSVLKIRVSIEKGGTNEKTGEEYDDRNVVKGFYLAPQAVPADS